MTTATRPNGLPDTRGFPPLRVLRGNRSPPMSRFGRSLGPAVLGVALALVLLMSGLPSPQADGRPLANAPTDTTWLARG